jgi:diguanylate cyclase (GGDEF)-like protein
MRYSLAVVLRVIALLLPLLWSTEASALKTLLLSQHSDQVFLEAYGEILVTTDSTIGIDLIRSKEWSSLFQPDIAGVLRSQITKDSTGNIYWTRFLVRNDRAVKFNGMLELAYPHYDVLNIFEVREALPLRTHLLGHQNPERQDNADVFGEAIEFNLAPGEKVEVYVQAKFHEVWTLPLMLFEEQKYRDWRELRWWLMGIFFGVLLLALVFNASIYLALKDNSAGAYVIYMAAWMFHGFLLAGFSNAYFIDEQTLWADRSLIWSTLFTEIIAMLFVRSFLQMSTTLPRLDVWFKAFILFNLLVLPITYFIGDPKLEALLSYASGNTFTFLTFLAIGLRVRHQRPAMYLLVAWTAMVSGVAIYSLSIAGGFPYWHPLKFFALQIGAGIEAILLCLAIASKLYAMRAEKTLMEATERERLEVLVDERTQDLEKLRHDAETLAMTDVLTSLPNRRSLMNDLANEVSRAQRYGDDLFVIMIDLDFFKKINDQYGHQTGDEVLVAVAKVLSLNIRDFDRVGRIGGEEFAMVLPKADPEKVMHIAERIRTDISAVNIISDGHPVEVTASFGVSLSVRQVENQDELLRTADDALYEAKAEGRNCVHIATR